MDSNIDLWKEPLPKECPPKDSYEPDKELFFRLVSTLPPTNIDFCSHRFLDQNKKFNIPECIARSLSLFKDIDSIKRITKYPVHKNKIIIGLVLTKKDGVVKQTFSDSKHFSWWVKKTFNLVIQSAIIPNE
jgi:hypothetical protein